MAKFKVGDKIKGRKVDPRRYNITNERMSLAVVTETYDGMMDVKVLKHDCSLETGRRFNVVNDDKYFALVEPAGKKGEKKATKTWSDKAGYDITVSRAPGSDMVVAEVRSEGTRFTGSAKCSKDDEFDIGAGIHLAVERALKAKEEYFEMPKEPTNSRGVKVGDFVKVTEEHYGLRPGDLAEVIGLGSFEAVYLATPRTSSFVGNCCRTDPSKLVQPYGYTSSYAVLARQPVRHKPGECK